MDSSIQILPIGGGEPPLGGGGGPQQGTLRQQQGADARCFERSPSVAQGRATSPDGADLG
jgi:hypothetical protein